MKSEMLEEVQRQASTKLLRALILEDSGADFKLILQQLRSSGFQVEHTRAENEKEFCTALEEKDFDVVLSEYRVATWTGLEAVLELRKMGKDIPFLLVTEALGEEAAVECIKRGATDYILKDNLSRLPSALTRALAEKALQDENARAQEALRISEARNRDLVENSAYGIFRVAADGSFLDANPTLLRITGCASNADLLTLNLARTFSGFQNNTRNSPALAGKTAKFTGPRRSGDAAMAAC
jgi:CheY-like chemotaxis protein